MAGALVLLSGKAWGQGWPARDVVPAPSPQPAQGTIPSPAPRPVPATGDEDVLEGRQIARIVLLRPAPGGGTVALEGSLAELAWNQLRSRVGEPFEREVVRADVARIDALGKFRAVEARGLILSDGAVELAVMLDPGPTIGAVQTVGNTVLSDQELQRLIDVLVGTPVDPTQLERAARRIRERYRDEGYTNVAVTVDEDELRETGVALFRVREGVKTHLTGIRFRGNHSYSDAQLRQQIKSITYPAIFGDSRADPQRLLDDEAALLSFYKDRGYIDARVAHVLTPSADGREALAEFIIEEGPLYTLRGVKIVYGPNDRQVFSPEQAIGLMTMKPGDVYGASELRRSVEAITGAYGRLGYADATVSRRELRAGDSPEVDLVLVIKEGQRWRTGLVEVTGNTITRDDVIRRHILLRPDRVLDATAVAETERRIRSTRLFDPGQVKVALQPPSVDEPGYRDVIVEVAEKDTGQFNFGASVGSDLGVTGLLSLTQTNFDMTDTPDTWGEFWRGEAFRGGGQTFTITVQPGDRYRNFTIGLTEPSLLGSDISGSARAYFRQRVYRNYDEKRVGALLSLGRRFGSRWTINAPLRLESIELSDIDEGSPTDYFDVADQRLLASVGITLTRTTLDRELFPTKGTKLSFGIEQFVPPGEDTFTQLSAEFQRYFKLEEDVLGRSTTLLLRTRASYITGDSDDVPFYERLYLGGQDFRGFALRGASPVGLDSGGAVTDDPVGGNWLFFAGAELTRPIVEETIALVGFVDSGTVRQDVGLDEYRLSVGFGVRIAVPFFGQAPLAFDFGFPILKEDTDRERLFTFTIDLPFN